jgi:outer membrane protein OmpA-like peptidoglycan-associated protein/tetratricopeptide (TPR) repeat protein
MRTFFFLLFSVLFLQQALGQQSDLKKADTYFDRFQYASAAAAYEKILALDTANADALKNIIVCYRKLNDSPNAEKWLARMCARDGVDSNYFRQYGEALASNKKYEHAVVWYKKYLDKTPDDAIAKLIASYKTMNDFYKDSSLYSIRSLPFNSKQADFSPAYYQGGILFCSARSGSSNKATYAWDNSAYIDLYYVPNLTGLPLPFTEQINSSLHEGPATASSRGDTLFFTRNSQSRNSSKNSDGITRLSIFYSVQKDSVWQKAQSFELNNEGYSLGHPALAPDHKLYFVSDMPGGLGGTDLYWTRYVNGHWSAPVNLGPGINTSGNEMFPYIDQQGNLYFASTTHAGLGGLDNFRAEATAGGFKSPSNLGYPINSSKDDFGFIIKNDQGYFSSNRGSDAKDDNLYAFTIDYTLYLTIRAQRIDGKPVDHFTLELTENGAAPITLPVDQVATRAFNRQRSYDLTCTKDGYQPKHLTLTVSDLAKYRSYETIVFHLEEALPKPIAVTPRGQQVLPPTVSLFEKNEIGQLIELDIRYDVNKSNIRKDAAAELDKLVIFLQKNPAVTIELGSHTDSRGSEDTNLALSQKRATAAALYVTSKGISIQRIVPVGYGENNLKIRNAKSEEEHQQNRRTTVKIIRN